MGSHRSAKAGTFAIAAGVTGLLTVGGAPLAFAAGEAPADPGSQGQAVAADAPASAGPPPQSAGTAAEQSPSTPAAADDGQATAAQAQDEHRPADPPEDAPAQAPTGPETAEDRGAGAGSVTPTSDRGNTPPGNNGTIKIHEVGTAREDTRNEPHVSCEFLVEFYGYDGGPQSITDMDFELWSPTRGGTYSTSAAMDPKPATRTSGNQWDFEMAFDADDILTDAGAPHEQQGYHVKLTVHVTGSQGSDVKHKVFWLSPCPTAPGGGEGGGVVLSSNLVTTALTPSTPATESVVAASVLGSSFVAPAAAPAPETSPAPATVGGVHYARQPAAASLARTGIAAASLATLGGGLLATGTALARGGRRRRT